MKPMARAREAHATCRARWALSRRSELEKSCRGRRPEVDFARLRTSALEPFERKLSRKRARRSAHAVDQARKRRAANPSFRCPRRACGGITNVAQSQAPSNSQRIAGERHDSRADSRTDLARHRSRSPGPPSQLALPLLCHRLGTLSVFDAGVSTRPKSAICVSASARILGDVQGTDVSGQGDANLADGRRARTTSELRISRPIEIPATS